MRDSSKKGSMSDLHFGNITWVPGFEGFKVGGGDINHKAAAGLYPRMISVAKSCPVLCDSMDYSMSNFPVFHYLLELAQTHVH